MDVGHVNVTIDVKESARFERLMELFRELTVIIDEITKLDIVVKRTQSERSES